MKPKSCPKCGYWLSQDEHGYYCTECDYQEEYKITTKWSWSDE